ncbi:MAG: AarF/ABC1/UbiB kinase family protein [Fimbriimonadales bacterium]|nr:AarF/ABC1/UbiB kinase family protein [Fimbriimonadales bacterium]
MRPIARRVRSLQRYRDVVGTLARHGFGGALEYLSVHRRLSLSKGELRVPEEPLESPAQHLRAAMEELGPTFVKLGQILSTRSDLLPEPFIEELRKLQDSVPAEPWDTMRPVIEAELRRPLEEVFAAIHPEPIGAASLSQVYAAQLLDGTPVAVKVQRPRIREVVELDLEILHDLASLAQRTQLGELYDPETVAEDFAFTLLNELDYRRELRNAEQFRRNFEGVSEVHIPVFYPEYCTERLLVMERLQGIKVDAVDALRAAGHDTREIALRASRLIIKEVLEDGFFHADPHPGNYLILPDGRIGVLDFGMVGVLNDDDRLNLTRLYIAIVRLDTHAILNVFARMGAFTRFTDRPKLARAAERIINKYRGRTLKESRFTEFWNDLTELCRHYHLRLPSNLWLVGKTLAMLEGIGRQLDPDYDLFEVSKPFVRQLSKTAWLPALSLQDVVEQMDTWRYLLREMPAMLMQWLQSVERGKVPVEAQIGATQETLDRLDAMITRLSLSMLVAAFIVGLALLLPATRDIPFGTPLTIAGFVGATILGVWLLVSILKKRH